MKSRINRIFAGALALGAIFLAGAAHALEPVAYLDWNPATRTMTNAVCTAYEVVTAETAAFADNTWYVVPAGADILCGSIAVSGSAHLILCDGSSLKATGAYGQAGIEVCTSGVVTNSLTIYGQTAGTGELAAQGGNGNEETSGFSGAGIGGGGEGTGGMVTIYGGTIKAIGGRDFFSPEIGSYDGAGIGGGGTADGGTVMICGGTVTAGGGTSAGIGGGGHGSGGTMTVHGGTVTASSASQGAGIGGGNQGNGGTVTVYGGTVTATGSVGGAGIGGGNLGNGGTMTVYGGTVTASSVSQGAGIGGGNLGNGGTVTVYGGTVTASGGGAAGGIGAGASGISQGTLTVGENVIVMADENDPPTTKKEPGAGGAITLGGEYHYFIEIQPPSAEIVSARQRWPWNGKVDVVVNAENLGIARTYALKLILLDGGTNYTYTTGVEIAGVTSTNGLAVVVDAGTAEGWDVQPPAKKFTAPKLLPVLVASSSEYAGPDYALDSLDTRETITLEKTDEGLPYAPLTFSETGWGALTRPTSVRILVDNVPLDGEYMGDAKSYAPAGLGEYTFTHNPGGYTAKIRWVETTHMLIGGVDIGHALAGAGWSYDGSALVVSNADVVVTCDGEMTAEDFAAFIGEKFASVPEGIYQMEKQSDGSYRSARILPKVTAVSAVQHEPWDGLVDVNYTVGGLAADGAALWVTVTSGGVAKRVTTLTGDVSAEPGTYRMTWNYAADWPDLDAGDVQIEVGIGAVEGAAYCVVDLSGGKDAASYPVEYLLAEPAGGFNVGAYKTNRLVLKLCPAGSFIMGDDQTKTDHTVTLTKPFYLGLFETTQAQWENVTGVNPARDVGEAKPVNYVSYNDIRGAESGTNWPAHAEVDETSFLGILRQKTELAFDLPTEAQWEYACRAGTTTTNSFGDAAAGDYMWCQGISGGKIQEVGTKLANPWGFYDMYGNVAEWCLDWWGGESDLVYGDDPRGPSSGRCRMPRGGNVDTPSKYCNSSERGYSYRPTDKGISCGFRLTRTLSDAAPQLAPEATGATVTSAVFRVTPPPVTVTLSDVPAEHASVKWSDMSDPSVTNDVTGLSFQVVSNRTVAILLIPDEGYLFKLGMSVYDKFRNSTTLTEDYALGYRGVSVISVSDVVCTVSGRKYTSIKDAIDCLRGESLSDIVVLDPNAPCPDEYYIEGYTVCVKPVATVVAAKQRWPWNGKVDVVADFKKFDAAKTYQLKFRLLDISDDGATTNFYTYATGVEIAGVTATNGIQVVLDAKTAAEEGTPEAKAFAAVKLETVLTVGGTTITCGRASEDPVLDLRESIAVPFGQMLDLAYSDTAWGASAQAEVGITANEEPISGSSLSGDGAFSWTPTVAGVYALVHNPGGLTATIMVATCRIGETFYPTIAEAVDGLAPGQPVSDIVLFDPNAPCPEDYMIQNGRVIRISDQAAMIGEVYYETIADAVAAANDGDTITLNRHLEVRDPVAIAGKTLTIDFNGMFLGNGLDILDVSAGADVTLVNPLGTGLDDMLDCNLAGAISVEEGSSLVIYGGTYDRDVGDYVAEGYRSAEIVAGKTWKVLPCVSVPVAREGLAYNGSAQSGFASTNDADFVSGALEGTAGGDYAATFSPAAGFCWTDGSLTNVTVAFSIGRLPLTVTARPKTITYGDEPANDGVIYEGFLEGEDETVLGGALAFDYSYARFDDVGEYDITPKGLVSDNYEIAFTKGTLTVNPKELTIDGIMATARDYDGSAAVGLTGGELAGLVNDDDVSFALGTGSAAAASAGDAVTVAVGAIALTGEKADNYVLPEPEGGWTTSVKINRKRLTIEGLEAVTRPYDGTCEVVLTNGTLVGAVEGDDVAAVIPPTGTIESKDVGSDKPVAFDEITLEGSAAANYTLVQPTVVAEVTKAALTLTAENKQCRYGEEPPELTFAAEGFAEGEDETVLESRPALACAYTAATTFAEPTKDFAITIAGAVASNYEIAFVDGVLAVAGDFTEFPAVVPGLVYSGAAQTGAMAANAVVVEGAADATDAGDYAVTYVPAAGYRWSDGSATNVTVNYTIAKKPLTLTAEDKNCSAGEEPPAYTFVAEGFAEGEDASVFTVLPVFSCDYTKDAEIDEDTTFEIAISSAEADNYAITFVNGTLSVKAVEAPVEPVDPPVEPVDPPVDPVDPPVDPVEHANPSLAYDANEGRPIPTVMRKVKSTYRAWLKASMEQNAAVVGSVTFSLAAPTRFGRNKGAIPIQAVVFDATVKKSAALKGRGVVFANGTVEVLLYKGKAKADDSNLWGAVRFQGDSVVGQLKPSAQATASAVVEGGLVADSKSSAAKYAEIRNRYPGAWSAQLGLVDGGKTNLCFVGMKISRNGTVKYRISEQDGTSYRGTTKVLLGKEGWSAVPLAVAKRVDGALRSIACVLWIADDDSVEATGAGCFAWGGRPSSVINRAFVKAASEKLLFQNAAGEPIALELYKNVSLRYSSGDATVTGSMKVKIGQNARGKSLWRKFRLKGVVIGTQILVHACAKGRASFFGSASLL